MHYRFLYTSFLVKYRGRAIQHFFYLGIFTVKSIRKFHSSPHSLLETNYFLRSIVYLCKFTARYLVERTVLYRDIIHMRHNLRSFLYTHIN